MTSDTSTTPNDPIEEPADDPPSPTAEQPEPAPTELGGEDQAGVAPTARKAKGVRSFADVGVHPDLVEALTAKGFDAPFPIQELTLPIATKGHDVIGQARTGTGKTLAFGLALLGRLTPGGGTQALVIVPTRELCIQVAEELQLGKVRGLRVIAVYGGVGYEEQEAAFDGGHEIVVGTPGRLLDHVNKGNLKLDGVTELVLDEADEMLDMGFLPDVERLIQACNDDRHGMLFSATMPTEVVKLARRYLDHPTFMRADTEALDTAPNVEQHFFEVHRMDKPRVLARILQSPEREGVYVFVRTKHMADRLVRELEDLGTAAIAIHGDLRQSMREKNLDKFRDGSATVLVATEVAARGLDVENVTHVINYDCPDDEKMYLHRIGRTARAGNKGAAITFCEFNEVDRLNVIRKKVGAVDVAVVPVFSPSEILTERFDLPAERPWDAQVAGSKAGTRTDRRSPDSDSDRGKGAGRGQGRGKGGDRGRSDGDRKKDDGRSKKDDGRSKRDSGRTKDGGGKGDGDRKKDGGARERDQRPEASGPETSTPPAASTSSEGAPSDAGRARERRSSSSDGRPKSSRRTEGGGPDRDGDRDRRDRQRAARDGRPNEERSGATDGAAGSDAGPSEDRGAGTRTRARTRTRTRTPSAGASSTASRGEDRSPDSGGDTDRGGARGGARSRDRRDRSGSGGDPSRASGGGSSRGGGGRARAGSEGGGRSDADGSGDGGSDKGRSGGNRGGRGDAGRDGGGGSGRSAGGRGGRDRGGEARGGRDRRGDDASSPTPTAPRGPEARGEGEPALARRVKVEHLP